MIKSFILSALARKAYPIFACEDCLGMPEYGCSCAAMGASAPGIGPTRTQQGAQWLFKKLQAVWFPNKGDVSEQIA